MIGFVIAYIILFLMAAAYVAINVFHIFRFRLQKDPADKSFIALFVYLALIVSTVGFSIVAGIIAYNT